MTLEQLRIFVAVAECQHVTAAAKALRLTQSAVSAAVRALEARHAVPLFDRVGRRVALTAAGRTFLSEARAVLAQAAAAEAALDDLAGLKRGRLRLAASQTVANAWLPAILVRYRTRFPGIALSLQIGNSHQVRAWLSEGVVDLGFVEDLATDDTLSAVMVAEDDVVLVAPPALLPPTADATAILSALPWILREPGSGTRAIFEAALPTFGLSMADLTILLALPSNESVRAAVLTGAGATALSRRVVAAEVQDGRLVVLPIVLPKRHFYLLHGKARGRSRAEQALCDLIGVQIAVG